MERWVKVDTMATGLYIESASLNSTLWLYFLFLDQVWDVLAGSGGAPNDWGCCGLSKVGQTFRQLQHSSADPFIWGRSMKPSTNSKLLSIPFSNIQKPMSVTLKSFQLQILRPHWWHSVLSVLLFIMYLLSRLDIKIRLCCFHLVISFLFVILHHLNFNRGGKRVKHFRTFLVSKG